MNHFCLKIIVCSLFIFFLVEKSFAQTLIAQNDSTKKTQIQIINVNKLKAVDSLQFKKLIGNVELQQDNVIFTCDSAYLYEADNSIDAFGNVHIQQADSIDIYANRLKYDGSTRFARLYENVELYDGKTIIHSDTLHYYVEERRALLFKGVDISDEKVTIVSDSVEYLSFEKKAYFYENVALTDGEMFLTADEMDYDYNTGIGTYVGNGEMMSNNSLLKSDKGWYNSNTNKARFNENVYVKDSIYEITTDLLLYDLKTKKAEFEGTTNIISEDSEINANAGFYDQQNDIISLQGESSLNNGPQFLTADSLYFEKETGWGFAFGEVYWQDTSQNIILECNSMRYNQDSSKIVAFDQLIFKQVIEEADTLFLIADTLETIPTKESDSTNLFLAHANVKLFKNDFQGVCDSLSYSSLDSVFRMYLSPIIWFDSTQLNADTIFLTTENSNPSEIQLRQNSWIVNENQTGIYNQLKGKNINGLFSEGDLSKILIKENAESIYFAQDSAKAYIGVNQAKSKDMQILFEEQEIQRIKFLGESNATFDPMKKINPISIRLDGFAWNENLRPPKRLFVKGGMTESEMDEQNKAKMELQNVSEENSKDSVKEIEKSEGLTKEIEKKKGDVTKRGKKINN